MHLVNLMTDVDSTTLKIEGHSVVSDDVRQDILVHASILAVARGFDNPGQDQLKRFNYFPAMLMILEATDYGLVITPAVKNILLRHLSDKAKGKVFTYNDATLIANKEQVGLSAPVIDAEVDLVTRMAECVGAARMVMGDAIDSALHGGDDAVSSITSEQLKKLVALRNEVVKAHKSFHQKVRGYKGDPVSFGILASMVDLTRVNHAMWAAYGVVDKIITAIEAGQHEYAKH